MSKGRPDTSRTYSFNDPEIVETVFFWAGLGITPSVAMEAIGVAWDGPEPIWHDVLLAMAVKLRGRYADPVLRRAA